MYRLLIVDDEPIIANALYEVFQNLKTLDLDVCKAYSGNEALEWLNSAKIDIVLTDIQMPGIDGLQLLEHIYNNWPLCKVIILTGHNDFDYVYHAIQHKGISYLLKTEGYCKIIKAVEDAASEIDRSLMIENLLEKANQQVLFPSLLLQKEYFSSLLKGEMNKEDICKERFHQFRIPLKVEEPVLLVLGRLDNLLKGMSFTERSQNLYSLKLIADQYFSTHTDNSFISDENSDFLWLIQPRQQIPVNGKENEYNTDKHRLKVFIKGMLEMIQESCQRSMHLTISFAVNSEPVEWDKVVEKYSLLKQLLDYRIGQGTEMILTDENLVLNQIGNEDSGVIHKIYTGVKKIDTLETYLERGQEQEFFLLFDEITLGINEVKSMHYNPALEVYYSIALVFLSFVNRWNLSNKIAFNVGLADLTHAEHHGSWEQAVLFLKRLANIIFAMQADEQKKRATDAISVIQNHINDHLKEDLSLVRLAELVYFNPSYLSRLFKQVTSENLSEYIHKARVKRAKQLLEKPNIKIHEVSEAIGYGSAQNFTRFFKKVTNVTPQEYREAYLNK